MNRSLLPRLLSLMLLLLCFTRAGAQQIDLEHIGDIFGKGKPFKFGGGLSANSIFNTGNSQAIRSPFTWYLNGSLNLNVVGQFNLPFSFNLTNAGVGYSYPTKPNRLSLHPTYKGVTAHLGDVAMSFSPYTLNGYQFTGVGIDINTSKMWAVSGMYGRLNNAVEFDSINMNGTSAYRRMGYGLKANLQQEKFGLGFIVFHAKDDENSLLHRPDTLGIFPQANIVISVNANVRPAKGLEFAMEYANSALTLDKRDASITRERHGMILPWFMDMARNTYFYKALKGNMNYTIGKSTVGIGYESIDPGYRTLGSYFMNNDLENITFNYALQFLKDKAHVAMNIGYQRDDLNHSKTGSTNRMVGSLNLSYAPLQNLNTNFSYSSFQTFMHIKSQFDYINAPDPNILNMDTLNFKQISQNFSFSTNYSFGKNKERKHLISLNLSMQDAADFQNNVVRKGNESGFYNGSTAYTLMLVPRQISITSAFNVSYNTIGRNDFLTLGPTLGANAKLFNKKLTTGFSTSYNASLSENQNTKVLNLRMNTGYLMMKSHNLSLSAMQQMRWARDTETNNLTVTLGYNYSF